MSRSLAAVCAAALLGCGCGYVGGPLPPLANVPAAVTDLAATQRGDKLIVQFTVPTLTTEGVVIKEPLRLDLAIDEKSQPERTATKGVQRYEIPSAPWTGKEVGIAVRVIAENGKDSAWSPTLRLPVVPPPAQPADVRAESAANGVRLTWSGAGEHFRVLRKAPGETRYSVAATDVTGHEWIDTNAAFGAGYSYLVQSFVPLAGGKMAESDLSTEVTISPVPPPPVAPTGLRGIAGTASIELSWDANGETDVTGYRIYRAAPGGDFEKLADTTAIPTYSDRAVEQGKSYRYAISALSAGGREGPRSAAIEVAMP